VPGDLGTLSTCIPVVSVEISRRNNLAARCSSQYPLALMKSLNLANSLHETLLLLWLVASPWFLTAKCQPSSPCGNSKEKCSWSYAGCVSLIRYNPLPYRCKMSRSAPMLSSKMAATSLHVGRLCVRQSTPRASRIANRTFRTSWFPTYSPARRNISTNEFTRLRPRTLGTVAANCLTNIRNTASHIYLCFHITTENVQLGQACCSWCNRWQRTDAMTYCSFSSAGQLLVNPGIFRKRCTHGRKCKDAVAGPDLD